MRDAAKAPSAGSSLRQARRLGRIIRGAVAFVAALAAFYGISASAAVASSPTLTMDPVSTHSIVTAHLSGEVSVPADGLETYWCLETAEAATEAWSGFCYQGPLQPGEAAPVSQDVSGLKAGTEYEARLSSNDFTVEEHSSTVKFTTDSATAPTLALDPPGTVAYTTAQLSGSIDPEGGNEDAQAGLLPISWELQVNKEGEGWNTAGSTSENPLEGSNAESSSPVAVTAEATGLAPGADYQYRLLAHYAALTAETEEADWGEFTTLAVAKPAITNLSVSNLEAESAHLSAEVDPNGTDPAFETSWHFECVAPGPACGEHSGTVPPGTSSAEVSADLTGLEPNTAYYVLLVASNAGGQSEATTVPQPSFTTIAVSPTAQTLGAAPLGETQATLNGWVNPRNSATSYWFEWGAADCASSSCQSQPVSHDADAGSGGEPVHVTQTLTGLSPEATYHFRLVTENSAGTTPGPDLTFTTTGAPASGPCPNEAIREEQHSTFLPECRAYEMVSPPDKNGAGVSAVGAGFVASTDGNGLAYLSQGSYGDTVGSGFYGTTTYLARRAGDGWVNHAITPTPRYDHEGANYGSTIFSSFSGDLSRAVVSGRDLPGTATPFDGTVTLYGENTATRDLSVLPTPLAGESVPSPEAFKRSYLFSFVRQQVPAASADSRQIAFNASVPLLSDVPLTEDSEGHVEGAYPEVYEWDDGALRLASILPNGDPALGAQLATPIPPGGELTEHYRQTVSPDGTRILFMASGQLFMRIDHTRTAWISKSENQSFAGQADEVILQEVTGDSRHVIFDTTSPLLEEDEDNGPDLYLYTDGPDPEHEPNLQLVSDRGNAPGFIENGTSVVGSSSDATRIYFLAGHGEIRAWHDGVSVQAATHAIPKDDPIFGLSATNTAPGGARVTPDGRYLAFFASGSAPPHELFLYDGVRDTLMCASCRSKAETEAIEAEAGEPVDEPNVTLSPRAYKGSKLDIRGARPRFLAPDGRVFFTSGPTPLIRQDRNGTDDVYVYDPATETQSLISSGISPEKSQFADASSNGGDIFIITTQKLVGADKDGSYDVYDVRAGGGFSEPQPIGAPCSGEVCQGNIPLGPPLPSQASSQSGLGNVKTCRKHRRHCRSRHRHRKRHAHRKLGGQK